MMLSVAVLITTFVAFKLAFAKIYAKSVATQTRIKQARRMEEMPKHKRSQTCVILGSGVSGSLSAAIASRHFQRVIVVDPFRPTTNPKSLIPQVDQLHAIAPITTYVCQSLWPKGIFDSIFTKFGGRFTLTTRYAYEFLVCGGPIRWNGTSPGYTSKSPSSGMSVTRRTFHDILRTLLQKHTPSVTVIAGKANRARFSSDDQKSDKKNRVEAIEVQHAETGECEWIECGLLIDCSGSYRAFRKLIANDELQRFHEPKREKYNLQVIYSTATIDLHPKVLEKLPLPKFMGRIPENLRKDTTGSILLINGTFTPVDRFFMVSRQDGNKIAICSISFEAEQKIDSLDAFEEAVQACYYIMYGSDIDPWFRGLMELLRENEDLMQEKVKFQHLDDKDSYIHDLNTSRLPNNLLLLGDSYAKLNPAFGQGMQKASGEAMTLHCALLDNQETETDDKIEKAVNSFNISRHPWIYGLFKMNRALDMDRKSIKARNPQISEDVGKFEREFLKGLWNYAGKKQDIELGTLFWSSIFVGTVAPAVFLQPYYFYRILYGMYCM